MKDIIHYTVCSLQSSRLVKEGCKGAFEHDSKLFVRLPGATQELERLIREPNKNSARFTLLWAPSKAGKTFTLCHLISEAMQQQKKQPSAQRVEYYVLDCAKYDRSSGHGFQCWFHDQVPLLSSVRRNHMLIVMDNFDAVFENHSMRGLCFARDVVRRDRTIARNHRTFMLNRFENNMDEILWTLLMGAKQKRSTSVLRLLDPDIFCILYKTTQKAFMVHWDNAPTRVLVQNKGHWTQ